MGIVDEHVRHEDSVISFGQITVQALLNVNWKGDRINYVTALFKVATFRFP